MHWRITIVESVAVNENTKVGYVLEAEVNPGNLNVCNRES